jgi:hypothetical protein
MAEIGRAGLVILFHAGIDVGIPEPCHPPDRSRESSRFVALV